MRVGQVNIEVVKWVSRLSWGRYALYVECVDSLHKLFKMK